jgi:hypothetical protein
MTSDQVEPRQESFQTFRAADIGWENGGVKPSPHTAAIPHPWHLHTNGTNACLDIPLGKIAVADAGLPSLGIVTIGIPGQQYGNFHLDRLG